MHATTSKDVSVSELQLTLAAVVDTWPTLPEPVQAGIAAMVRASKGDA